MKYGKALDLANSLLEIQSLTRLIEPLIEEGRDEFEQFTNSLNTILSNVFPTYTVAFTGPVNSGKSTVLSCLLQEAGDHPIASVGPSNETFAPMIISYSRSASLLVRYFTVEIVQRISQHLTTLEKQGGAAHEIAAYRQLRNALQRIQAVTASDAGGGILRKIDLSSKNRAQIINIIREYVAQSSKRQDVYGVYKVELTFPGKVLQELNNVRFIDLFGFGEPSPLINMKYTRFISEEATDAVVYVFPDRSVTADFNRLFEIPRFLEEIVATKRFFIVLNKADAYPGVSASQWNRVTETFRTDLARHIPILRKYAPNIPIFVLSAASIDGSLGNPVAKEVRDASHANLWGLRNQLRSLSKELELTSADPSLYLGAIFDLLGSLDVFAQGAEESLRRIEKRLPAIARLVDNISANEADFDRQKADILEPFRASVESELERHLQKIDYENIVNLDSVTLDLGDPRSLFRWMVDNSQKSALSVYDHSLVKIFTAICVFIDEHLLAAYRQYVSMQSYRLSLKKGFGHSVRL
jgi:hypothetical protein